MLKHTILWVVAAGLVFALAPAAQAALMGELGILDLTANGGINPGTGNPWALNDVYHLTYITSTTRDATSTDIADYNAFVQADAVAEGIGTGVTWSAMGSTVAADAKDNAVVTGPVLNVNASQAVAADAADLWDLQFPGAKPTMVDGSARNVWFGTMGGGVEATGYALGTANPRLEWTGWGDWGAAWKTAANTTLMELVAISSPLQIVPDPATLALLSIGGLGLLIRRRRVRG